MSKQTLFDENSDDEVEIKIENEYAKKYDAWREKEEIHKLEQKYGSKALNSDASISSDSEDESDAPLEVSEETEKQFLKTLALLKTKDPRIYDPSYKCFVENTEKEPEKVTNTKSLTFADSDDEDDDESGNIFTVVKKASEIMKDKNETKQSKSGAKKEEKIKDYLTGKAEHIDETEEQDLAPLKALWSDPKLNEGEAFLRDYILNKKYLEEDDAEDKLRDDEDLEADEKLVEEQGKFERAYNFRFEEPDEEYLKRFPRTMNYIRPKDDRRSRKRVELRTRKEEEKLKKMEEIGRLKALKLKEIQEKIAKIMEVTGNDELAFKEEDVEGDFDPEEHDKRMKAIFDEQYYHEADHEKPVFPDLDEELEIENWEKYNLDEKDQNADGLHCEDEDFNMDADYDPKKARTDLMEQLQANMGKKRRNRKRKSKLAELLEVEKPKFVPNTAGATYSDFMEEYYQMNCEDVIGGDLPTRFKYREVVPNDFGLTVEEILLADDKELTQWVPLKKIVKHRPENVERGDVKTYAKKAEDMRLKQKILPSLFKDLPDEPEIVVPIPEPSKKKKKIQQNVKNTKDTEMAELVQDDGTQDTHTAEHCTDGSKKKRKKHKKAKLIDHTSVINELDGNEDKQEMKNNNIQESEQDNGKTTNENIEVKKKHKKKKKEHNNIQNDQVGVVDKKVSKQQFQPDHNNVKMNGRPSELSNVPKRNKLKDGFIVENTNEESNRPGQAQQTDSHTKCDQNTQKSLKRKLDNGPDKQVPNKKKNKSNLYSSKSKNKSDFKKKQKDKSKDNQNRDKSENPLSKLSDERLKAYGLNPKKYRSFLKYKKF